MKNFFKSIIKARPRTETGHPPSTQPEHTSSLTIAQPIYSINEDIAGEIVQYLSAKDMVNWMCSGKFFNKTIKNSTFYKKYLLSLLTSAEMGTLGRDLFIRIHNDLALLSQMTVVEEVNAVKLIYKYKTSNRFPDLTASVVNYMQTSEATRFKLQYTVSEETSTLEVKLIPEAILSIVNRVLGDNYQPYKMQFLQVLKAHALSIDGVDLIRRSPRGSIVSQLCEELNQSKVIACQDKFVICLVWAAYIFLTAFQKGLQVSLKDPSYKNKIIYGNSEDLVFNLFFPMEKKQELYFDQLISLLSHVLHIPLVYNSSGKLRDQDYYGVQFNLALTRKVEQRNRDETPTPDNTQQDDIWAAIKALSPNNIQQYNEAWVAIKTLLKKNGLPLYPGELCRTEAERYLRETELPGIIRTEQEVFICSKMISSETFTHESLEYSSDIIAVCKELEKLLSEKIAHIFETSGLTIYKEENRAKVENLLKNSKEIDIIRIHRSGKYILSSRFSDGTRQDKVINSVLAAKEALQKLSAAENFQQTVALKS